MPSLAAYAEQDQAGNTPGFELFRPSLGGRAQFCLAGKESQAVEELRTPPQHQPAIHPSGIFGSSTQKIVNTFLAHPFKVGLLGAYVALDRMKNNFFNFLKE